MPDAGGAAGICSVRSVLRAATCILVSMPRGMPVFDTAAKDWNISHLELSDPYKRLSSLKGDIKIQVYATA